MPASVMVPRTVSNGTAEMDELMLPCAPVRCVAAPWTLPNTVVNEASSALSASVYACRLELAL